MIFFFFLGVEVRVFTVVVLKFLAFSTSKSHFIYFTTSLYNTLNIKCSIFFITHLKLYKQLIKIIKEERESEFFN